MWHDYIYGNCAGGGVFMPADPDTGNSLDSSVCTEDFSGWQSDWQQDVGSTYNPLAVSLGGLTSGQNIHGSNQTVTAYEDSATAGNITAHLKIGSTTDSTATLSLSPHNFSLDTLKYTDGQYAVSVDGTDAGSHTNSDSVTVNITNGDFNGDSQVNVVDLLQLAKHWNGSGTSYANGDINGDGVTNVQDLLVLAKNWNKSW
jgi:hypothetical protein